MKPWWINNIIKRYKDGTPDPEDEKYELLKKVHLELRKKYLKLKESNDKLRSQYEKLKDDQKYRKYQKSNNESELQHDEDLAYMKDRLFKGELLEV